MSPDGPSWGRSLQVCGPKEGELGFLLRGSEKPKYLCSRCLRCLGGRSKEVRPKRNGILTRQEPKATGHRFGCCMFCPICGQILKEGKYRRPDTPRGAFGHLGKKTVCFDVSQSKVIPGFWEGQRSLIPRTTSARSHSMPSVLNTATMRSTPTDLPDAPRSGAAVWEWGTRRANPHPVGIKATKGTSASLSCLRSPPAAETPPGRWVPGAQSSR